MARYICPSCGGRYNGKRCGSCLYENFAEEYTHGNHTHTGEPLVIRQPQRGPIPRKDPFECEKNTRSPRHRAVYIVLTVLLLGWAALGIGKHYSSSQNVTFPVPEAEMEAPAFPSDGITLYDDGELRIVADWEETRKYSDGIRVKVENNTQQDLTVVTEEILVNNYVMEHSSLFISAEAGHMAEGCLVINSTDLEWAGIEEVQQVSAVFEAYDSESYDTFVQTEYITLCSTDNLNQSLADQGETLYSKDGIRIVCKGYVPSDSEPDSLSEGELLFYLENRTDTTVEIYTDKVTANGKETFLFLGCSLPPNTQAVQQMFLFGLDNVHLNIRSREDIAEMTATFNLLPDDGSHLLTTDPLSIPFQLDWTK